MRVTVPQRPIRPNPDAGAGGRIPTFPFSAHSIFLPSSVTHAQRPCPPPSKLNPDPLPLTGASDLPPAFEGKRAKGHSPNLPPSPLSGDRPPLSLPRSPRPFLSLSRPGPNTRIYDRSRPLSPPPCSQPLPCSRVSPPSSPAPALTAPPPKRAKSKTITLGSPTPRNPASSPPSFLFPLSLDYFRFRYTPFLSRSPAFPSLPPLLFFPSPFLPGEVLNISTIHYSLSPSPPPPSAPPPPPILLPPPALPATSRHGLISHKVPELR